MRDALGSTPLAVFQTMDEKAKLLEAVETCRNYITPMLIFLKKKELTYYVSQQVKLSSSQPSPLFNEDFNFNY
jgi:hypothetical protein